MPCIKLKEEEPEGHGEEDGRLINDIIENCEGERLDSKKLEE